MSSFHDRLLGLTVSGTADNGSGTVAAIELRDVHKEFSLASGESVTAVKAVTTTIEPGEFVCVLGPSGHGKSTLLNLIAGFIEPTSGEVLTHGEPVRGPGADRGVVFQRDTLFMWKRVADNVAFGLKARGVPAADRDRVVERYLDIVGLTNFAGAWPKQLSGGMRRRVAIATVFANEPRVLLMDEPFTGLDYARRAVLYDVLLELWQRAGNTVFFVTHDIDEALTLAGRILVVVDGTIAHDLPLDLARPRGPDALTGPAAAEIRRTVLSGLHEAVAGTERTEVVASE